MLSQRHRFHGYGGLRPVYQKGRTVRGPAITLRYAERAGRPYRAAVVVSKKVAKSAVTRNRIRRRIYEIVRQAEPAAGHDLLFTVFSEEVADMQAEKLQRVITELLQKAAGR